MNWQLFGIALASGLLSFPVLTRNSSLAHKYATLLAQMVTAGSLALVIPSEQTYLVGLAVFVKHVADLAAWVIGTLVDKALVKVEFKKIREARHG